MATTRERRVVIKGNMTFLIVSGRYVDFVVAVSWYKVPRVALAYHDLCVTL